MDRPPIDQQLTFLVCRDLAQTAVFYEEVLGLPLILDQGSCRIYQTATGAFLGFCRQLGPQLTAREQTAGIILTLVSPDVDGWYHYLLDAGVTIEKPPTHNEKFNIYQLFARDPSGYLLEIQTFLDPAWPAATAR